VIGSVLRGLAALLVGLGLAVGGLWVAGPYEQVALPAPVGADEFPGDLDAWLAAREGAVPDLRPGDEARIVWAGAPGRRSALALVSLHGFSASPREIHPVVERTAAALGANLFLQRLSGHGRDGAAMAEPSAGDWLADAAEAMAVGRRLGDRVVLIGTSTGGTLASILAADPALGHAREGLAGVAFISPNFGVAHPAAALLSWPAARHWAPLVAGETRGFEPINDAHARHWTTEYPTVAALPMQALIDHAEALDWSSATAPALFHFSPRDRVVRPEAIESVLAAWGGPVTVERAKPSPGDDPAEHVIAGSALSPGRTEAAVTLLTGWIRGL
jgi:hypothetical protein